MKTDEKTENYYTSGLYNINSFLENQKKDILHYCSVKGMLFQIGDKKFEIKNSCLEVEMLWNIAKIF